MLSNRIFKFIPLFLSTFIIFAAAVWVFAEQVSPDCSHCEQQSVPECCSDAKIGDNHHAEAAECQHGSFCFYKVDEDGGELFLGSKQAPPLNIPVLHAVSSFSFKETERPVSSLSPSFFQLNIRLKNCVFLI